MTTFFIISIAALITHIILRRKLVAARWKKSFALYNATHSQKVDYYNYQTLAYLAIAPQNKTLDENIAYYKKHFIPENYWFCIEIVEDKVCNIQKTS